MKLNDVAICYKYDAKQALKEFLKVYVLGRKRPILWKCRVPVRKIKNLILNEGFGVTDGKPSWFYTAFARNDSDPLTNFAIDFIRANITRDSQILISGCGTGITAFRLADNGFRNITGIDLLHECISVANKVKQLGNYEEVVFLQMDGFNPNLSGTFDLITAIHWVFSAWMGNYGNQPAEDPKNPEVRQKLLLDFLGKYAPHLNKCGYLIIELTDAVADYRIESDHVLGAGSSQIYPVRHTPEQVQKCAMVHGLTLEHKHLCVSYGHHPRTSYVLRKI